MKSSLDELLREARPDVHIGWETAGELRGLINAAHQQAGRGSYRSRVFRSRVFAGAAGAVVLGIGGAAAATSGLGVPNWITDFGYDASFSYTDAGGAVCHEALLVTPYVSANDPHPPSKQTLDRVLKVARSVVADYEFSAMGKPTRHDVSKIGDAIDTELRERGLPEAYAFGFMGECESEDSK